MDNLQWQIGDVSITRVLEMLAPVPPAGCSRRHARGHRTQPLVAAAALRRRRRQLRALDPRAVRRVAGPQDRRRHVHRQRPGDPGHTTVLTTCDTPFLDEPRRGRLPARSVDTVVCTHLHLDHVGLEHDAGRRQVGPDVPERALPLLPRASGALGRRKATTGTRDVWTTRCSRSSTPGSSISSSPTTRSPPRSARADAGSHSRARGVRIESGGAAGADHRRPRAPSGAVRRAGRGRRPRHRPRAVGGDPPAPPRRARRTPTCSSSAPTSDRGVPATSSPTATASASRRRRPAHPGGRG